MSKPSQRCFTSRCSSKAIRASGNSTISITTATAYLTPILQRWRRELRAPPRSPASDSRYCRVSTRKVLLVEQRRMLSSAASFARSTSLPNSPPARALPSRPCRVPMSVSRGTPCGPWRPNIWHPSGRSPKAGRCLTEPELAGGGQALGQANVGPRGGARADIVSLGTEPPSLAGRRNDAVLDGWIFAAGPGAVACVWAGGNKVVEGGHHRLRQKARETFNAAVWRLAA